jgi:hypothetical protein
MAPELYEAFLKILKIKTKILDIDNNEIYYTNSLYLRLSKKEKCLDLA